MLIHNKNSIIFLVFLFGFISTAHVSAEPVSISNDQQKSDSSIKPKDKNKNEMMVEMLKQKLPSSDYKKLDELNRLEIETRLARSLLEKTILETDLRKKELDIDNLPRVKSVLRYLDKKMAVLVYNNGTQAYVKVGDTLSDPEFIISKIENNTIFVKNKGKIIRLLGVSL